MRLLVVALTVAFAGTAHAGGLVPCKPPAGPDEAGLSRHDGYINSSGACVHRPARVGNAPLGLIATPPAAPVGATAMCRDGSYSFSQHRSGTCSRHGGVSTWL